VRIAIAGGHGKVARRLTRRLTARGDDVLALVRNRDHVPDVESDGATGAVVDLEHSDLDTVAQAITGADAVVFAAGAGPGSGAARKDTMDRAGAVLLADAAYVAGVRRYLLVSSMGVDRPDDAHDDVFRAYLRAKAAAEEAVRERDLDWTVLRPGALTDDPGTGRVRLARRVERGSVPRDDVAAVLVALLDEASTIGLTLELVAGEDLVDAAVRAAGRGEPGDGSADAVVR
jgi:uncharacterized protein YbjT (DUF2867 family)